MKPESHEKQILRDLQCGVRLTQDIAKNLYGCQRLASRICRLKKDGFDIKREMITVPSRSGKAKVAVYWMEPIVKPKERVDSIGGQLAFL